MRASIIVAIVVSSSVAVGCGDDSATGTGGGGGGGTTSGGATSGGTTSGGTTSTSSSTATTSTGTGTPPPGFDCLGSVELPTTDATEAHVTFAFVDNIGLAPVPDLVVRVCARTDVDCASPVFEGTADADGHLDVTLPFDATGFDGYAIGEADGFLPTAWIGATPFLPDEGGTYEFEVFRSETLVIAAQSFGLEIDEAKATAIVNVNDCDGAPAAGAVVDVSVAAERVGYFTDGTPDAARTSTDASGRAFVLNADPGLAHVTAHLEEGGFAVGGADVPLLAGGGTVIFFGPTP